MDLARCAEPPSLIVRSKHGQSDTQTRTSKHLYLLLFDPSHSITNPPEAGVVCPEPHFE
jgi:hypothetical protein